MSNFIWDEENIKDGFTSDYLIKGYIVSKKTIIEESSHRIIPDTEIESLSLSTRSYNVLKRMRSLIADYPYEAVMVSDLLKLSPNQLFQLKNLGSKSANEIIEKVTAYLQSDLPGTEGKSVNKQNTIAPDYKVTDGVITHITSGKVIEDVLIDYIGLSIRAINSLSKGNISKLSELICLSTRQLEGFPNMGKGTVTNISDTVSEYLKADHADEFTSGFTRAEFSFPDKVTIPPLSTDYQVLAPDYAVVDGLIFHRKTYKVIPDIPIERLSLSVRSQNCMQKSGVSFVSELIGMPYESFKEIRNLGLLSVKEILEKLDKCLHEAVEESRYQSHPSSTVSAEEVLTFLSEHEFDFFSITQILHALPNAAEEDAKSVIAELYESGKIAKIEDSYGIYHPSFFDTINSLTADNKYKLDERAISVLQQRSAGKTLEEIGEQHNISRERARQIEKKAFEKITLHGKNIFSEDRFAYLFQTYAFERDFYFEYLDKSNDVWYYLSLRYSRGESDTSKALADDDLPISVRRKAEKYLHRGYIQIDGFYLPLKRGPLEEAVAEKYCKDEVPLETFFKYYEQFLIENGITDERLQINESSKNTRANRLAESNKILWKQNKSIRYYDIDGNDFSELLETLNLEQYENIEFSTRKFLIEYPDLMKRYDLRDEYEIHNLLKKIHAEKENPQLVFGRMPNLQFGNFDREKAVKELLFALAPISQDDLAKMISREYGIQEGTVKGNWFNSINEYYHNGMFSVDYEDMPEDHVRMLKAALTDDFYFFTELREIYRGLADNADLSLLTTYNLKKMGFLVGSSYALQHYPSAEAFFDHLMTTEDIVDAAPISKRYTGLSTYSAYLSKLKSELQIIEFEPYQYINIRQLEKLGITKDILREYGNIVCNFLVNDKYFSIRSLKNDGLSSEFDVLGFGDLFYASILKEDGRFSWQRVGNSVVFSPKGNSFSVHDFLVDYVNGVGSINVEDFSRELAEQWGIKLDRYTIVEKIKGGEVYYDPIMSRLYKDYSLYIEEKNSMDE